MCTERCFAWSAGAGSGSRPASFARISSQCAGMMTTKTFAAITVPIIAPTWSHAARGLKSSEDAHAASTTSARSNGQRTRPSETSRLSTSYAIHAAASSAIEIATATHGSRSSPGFTSVLDASR